MVTMPPSQSEDKKRVGALDLFSMVSCTCGLSHRSIREQTVWLSGWFVNIQRVCEVSRAVQLGKVGRKGEWKQESSILHWISVTTRLLSLSSCDHPLDYQEEQDKHV